MQRSSAFRVHQANRRFDALTRSRHVDDFSSEKLLDALNKERSLENLRDLSTRLQLTTSSSSISDALFADIEGVPVFNNLVKLVALETDLDRLLAGLSCVCNLTLWTTTADHTQKLAKHFGAYLVLYLSSSNPLVRLYCSIALGNLTREHGQQGNKARATLERQGALHALIKLVELRATSGDDARTIDFALQALIGFVENEPKVYAPTLRRVNVPALLVRFFEPPTWRSLQMLRGVANLLFVLSVDLARKERRDHSTVLTLAQLDVVLDFLAVPVSQEAESDDLAIFVFLMRVCSTVIGYFSFASATNKMELDDAGTTSSDWFSARPLETSADTSRSLRAFLCAEHFGVKYMPVARESVAFLFNVTCSSSVVHTFAQREATLLHRALSVVGDFCKLYLDSALRCLSVDVFTNVIADLHSADGDVLELLEREDCLLLRTIFAGLSEELTKSGWRLASILGAVAAGRPCVQCLRVLLPRE